jgi:tRNA threonylcarbamoyladenosine biosynthesis protein TsaB
MPNSVDQQPDQSRPILAIDTSSAQGGLALYDGNALSVRSWPAGRSHTTTVLAEIHHLVDVAGVDARELAAIAVAIGPGAFTGLRVGIGVAKGFHLAHGVPLVGVSTLEATALPFASCGAAVVATVSAGRGRLTWAWYGPAPNGVGETQPPRNGTVAELAAELAEGGPAIVVGELDVEQEATVANIESAFVPPRPFRVRQPGAVAEMGWRRWLSRMVDDAANLEPVYLSR